MTRQLCRFYAYCFAAYILIFVGFLSLGACATTNKNLVAAETVVHDSLARLDDLEHGFCKTNAEKFKQQCDDLNPLMVTLLKAGDSFNQTIAHKEPVNFLDLVKAGGEVYNALKALPSSASAQMYIELAKAVGQAGKLTTSGQ